MIWKPQLRCYETESKFWSWHLGNHWHCEFGPTAFTLANNQWWFLNDNQYPFAKWIEHTPVSAQQKLHLALLYSEHV